MNPFGLSRVQVIALRCAFLVMACLVWSMPARAQFGANNGPYATISAAYAACEAEKAAHWGQGTGGMTSEWCKAASNTTYAASFPNKILGCLNRSTECAYYETYSYTTGCTAGTSWQEDTHSCRNPDAECAAIKAQENDPESSGYNPETEISTRAGGTSCIGGCTWTCIGSCQSTTVNGILAGVRGHFGFTGKSCAVAPESPVPATKPTKPTEPVCKAASANQTYCERQDGKKCYTASTGRQICWNSGETGSKTDGTTAQARCAGTANCPAPTAPPGDTLTANGPPVQTVSTNTQVTNTNGTTSSTTTGTTTTTVNNYTTTYGTNAGTSDQGEPAGSSGGTDQVGGETGTVAGDGSCDQDYVVTGGDPVANKILYEIHRQNCEARARYERQGVGLENLTASVAADPGSPFNMPDAASLVLDKAGLSGGIGASSCPQLPALGPFGHFDQTKFCEIGSWLGFLFVGIALVWAYQVVFG